MIADHPALAIAVAAAAIVGTVYPVIAAVSSPQADDPAQTGIEFNPIRSPMPRCLTLSGTAPADDNKELWLAFRAADASDFYLLHPRKDVDGRRWRITDTVGNGVGGVTHEFFAFQIDGQMSEFLASIDPEAENGGGAYYFTTKLPPGVEVGEPDLTLVSAADPNPCT